MRILILGASDSEGTLLANFSEAWRERLRIELPALIGEPVEVIHKRFYVHLPGIEQYLERCIAESDPHLVILGATGYAFSTPSVGNRLRRLFGKRVGDWFEQRFSSFDNATAGGQGGWRERANDAAHAVAGRVIGREPLSTYEEVFARYRRTIERIARIESADAVVLGTTYGGPDIEKRVPGIRALVDRYNRELRAITEAHHFAFLDRQALISALPVNTARPDQMHTGEEVHAAYAAALIPMIAARVVPAK